MEKEVHRLDEYDIRDNVNNAKVDDVEKESAFLFSSRLNNLLHEKGIEQKELAEFIGMGDSAVSNYRKGKRRPQFPIIAKMADYLDVSVAYLCGDADSKNLECIDIGNTIGLTDEAIIQLTRYKQNKLVGDISVKPTKSKYYDNQIKLLSFFIESGVPFLSLLNQFCNYIDKNSELNNLNELLVGKNELDCLYESDETFIKKKVLEDELQIERFKIQENVFKLLEICSEKYNYNKKINSIVSEINGGEVNE